MYITPGVLPVRGARSPHGSKRSSMRQKVAKCLRKEARLGTTDAIHKYRHLYNNPELTHKYYRKLFKHLKRYYYAKKVQGLKKDWKKGIHDNTKQGMVPIP